MEQIFHDLNLHEVLKRFKHSELNVFDSISIIEGEKPKLRMGPAIQTLLFKELNMTAKQVLQIKQEAKKRGLQAQTAQIPSNLGGKRVQALV